MRKTAYRLGYIAVLVATIYAALAFVSLNPWWASGMFTTWEPADRMFLVLMSVPLTLLCFIAPVPSTGGRDG